ncbi:MAG TPA: hypothetical protein VNZ64_20515 [Candidatus Acidoferrum sp.]|jgi:Tfp pilus assembly protein PilV|nr:hypothetical protein [Candidatus Acidoferrum sp.]
MNRKGPAQRQTGRETLAYTLAEVLFAVVILAVIAGAFFAALSSGFAVVQTSREDLRATQILMQKAEATRLCRWDQLTNVTFQEQYDPFSATNGTAGVVYGGTVSVGAATNVPSTCSYNSNMCLVTVTLLWTNSYGSGSPVAHSRQMQTQVARYGLQNYIWGAQP